MFRDFIAFNKRILVPFYIGTWLFAFLIPVLIIPFVNDKVTKAIVLDHILYGLSLATGFATIITLILIVRGFFDFYKKRQALALLPSNRLSDLGFEKIIRSSKFEFSQELVYGRFNGYEITYDCNEHSRYQLFASVAVAEDSTPNERFDQLAKRFEKENMYFGFNSIEKRIPKDNVPKDWRLFMEILTLTLGKHGFEATVEGNS